MADLIVKRLQETDVVKFGPDATYQLLIGDDEGSTPVRTGIQTSHPGYVAPVHQHPYLEVLFVLEGIGEAWIDGRENERVTLRQGDTVAFPPNTPHSFRVVGNDVLRTLGVHASPKRVAVYKDGGTTDARGYRVN
jgi:mannose-6-phosphate isomerase-like protein (cupin superfamily)